MKPVRKFLLFALFLPACSLAQQNKLIVSQPDPITVKRGASVTAVLKVSTLTGFHVNSNKPRGEYLIPLTLTWNDGPLKATSVTYPEPELIQVGSDTLSVFTGAFQIRTEFTTPPNAGSASMTGKLRYQACNNQMCFRPTTAEIRLPVTIE